MTFPFDAWLKAGVSLLGLAPDHVWEMSLHDLRVLTETDGALGRAELDALCVAYPDGETDG